MSTILTIFTAIILIYTLWKLFCLQSWLDEYHYKAILMHIDGIHYIPGILRAITVVYILPVMYLLWILTGLATKWWLDFIVFTLLSHLICWLYFRYLKRKRPVDGDPDYFTNPRLAQIMDSIRRLNLYFDAVFAIFILVNSISGRMSLWEFLYLKIFN